MATIEATTKNLELLIARIRMRMRDYERVNRLTRGEEHPARYIAEALQGVLENFNNSIPILPVTYSWNTFPNQDLLIRATISVLWDSAVMVDAKNFNPVNVGGVTITSRQRVQVMGRIAQTLDAKVREDSNKLKMALQLRCSLGEHAVESEEGDQILLDYANPLTWLDAPEAQGI